MSNKDMFSVLNQSRASLFRTTSRGSSLRLDDSQEEFLSMKKLDFTTSFAINNENDKDKGDEAQDDDDDDDVLSDEEYKMPEPKSTAFSTLMKHGGINSIIKKIIYRTFRP